MSDDDIAMFYGPKEYPVLLSMSRARVEATSMLSKEASFSIRKLGKERMRCSPKKLLAV
jgi:hypothetical protein